MYSILTLASGTLLAVMIQMNGRLSARFGSYHAALYIHVVGAMFAWALLLVQKKKPRLICGVSWWMYLGGVIGVLTTVCNNLAFGKISITNISALGLFSQLLFSFFVDRFGLFGMPRHPGGLNPLGVLLSIAGIALMMDFSESAAVQAVLLSLIAGVSIVLSRIINARLSQKIGAMQGALVNHLAGLPLCFALAMLISENGTQGTIGAFGWCGGILGVLCVAICNITVPKLPAGWVTMLTLCGQLFGGMVLDAFDSRGLNVREFAAGILVAAGILLCQAAKNWSKTEEQK